MVEQRLKATTALTATTYRCIASRFPPIDLYEELSSPSHFDMFHALEGLTNPRLQRVQSAGAAPIEAAFQYVPTAGQGGRFNGDFAAYYCALEEQTAVAEVAFHRARLLRESQRPATVVDARVVVAEVNARALVDIRGAARRFAKYYQLDDYAASQAFGRSVYERDDEGILYSSVRCADGQCIAVFTPTVLSRARQSKHLELQWDGEVIVSVLQKTAYRWRSK
jgi:RES domain-containing protein